MIQPYAIIALVVVITILTITTGVIALLAFKSLGYGPAATNLIIGLALSVISWIGIGLASQSWFIEDHETRFTVVIVSLIIKCTGMVYENIGYWRLYTVSKGWWY